MRTSTQLMRRAACWCVLIALPWRALGAAPPEDLFPEKAQVQGITLIRTGTAYIPYLRIFKPVAGALYLPSGYSPEQALDDVPKRIEFAYFYNIRKEQFIEAGGKALQRNVPADVLTRLQPQIASINRLYQDVEPGDRYSLTYLPGGGTVLALNGRELGRVEGAEFGRYYYRIWLGDDPVDTSFRAALLGK